MKNYLDKIKTVLGIAIALSAINSCTEIEPANIDFDNVEASGFESDGSQTFNVNFSKSVSSEVTLEFEFTGSAVKNEDYTFDNETVIVPAGESSATVNFRLLDNDNYDPGTVKTITITLIGISGPGLNDVSLGDLTSYTFTINEDDMEVELIWETSSYDMRLALRQETTTIRDGSINTYTSKILNVFGNDPDGQYQVQSYMAIGGTVPVSVSVEVFHN